jgi:nicotinate dehydrogenase subunit B
VVQATSRCLLEEVAWDANGVTSLDWGAYPILRFPDVPEVSIDLIERRDTAPSGAGEATTYPMAAEIGNAVFDATGIRVRQGPFTPRRVMDAMRRRPT